MKCDDCEETPEEALQRWHRSYALKDRGTTLSHIYRVDVERVPTAEPVRSKSHPYVRRKPDQT